jgi:two-component system response regulator YcbB
MHVDDSKLSLKLVRKIISAGFKDCELVSILTSEFHKMMQMNYPLNDVDVLITDLLMPEISGHDILKYVKSINRNIFLTVLSSNVQELEKQKAYNNGADYFIEKPLTVEKIEGMCSVVNSRRSK